MTRPRLLLVFLVLALPLPACSRRAARIDVTPKKLKIYGLDRPQRLTARVLDKKERPLEIGTANFESTNSAIASVDAGGLVTPKSEGKTTITAKFDDVTASIPVEILDVKSLDVLPASARLVGPVGTQFGLQAVIKNSKDALLTMKPVWSSAQPGVATISPEGLVTAVTNGTTLLVAKVGDVQGASEVAVEIREIARLEVRPATALVRVGDGQRFEVVAYDANGRPIEGAAAIFRTSDPTIASVNVSGQATGLKTGAATIRALIGGVSAEATLIIN